MAPISMLLALLTTLDISHTILLHGQPIIPCSKDFQRESSSSYVTAANAFMKLDHHASALIFAYACEDQMGITVTKKVPVYQGILTCIPLNNLGLPRFNRK